MPSDSTLDSAPEDASQHPAAEPFEALLAPSPDAPQAGALDQSGYGGLAAPMDTLDLDPCVVPPLDDAVLNSGSVADVVDTASSVSGITDFLEPLAYLGLNPARAMLPGVEPQINSMVSTLGSAVRVSSMADAVHPQGGVGELVGRSHVGLAQVLGGLPALIPPLPGPAKMAGDRAPLARMTELLAPDGFTVPVGLLQMTQEILPTRPPLADVIGSHGAALFARVRSVADRARRLRPTVPAEASYAFDAYLEGDAEPMKDFLRRCLPWTMAPALVQQDEAQGERNRRKLKRVAKEWRRHEINRRELP
ncbi:hypothetical protein [Streptomyces collinus]|uniref:hypothetical protein n=1 Tax=Streptomyces collinus TaxID=42684 RepID=UPI0037D5D550